MSSTEATNGISRRAVLAGAAAIGGTIAVASASSKIIAQRAF